MRYLAFLFALLVLSAVEAHASTLLMVGEDRRINQETILKLRQQALNHDWHVVRWVPGAPVVAALDGGDIVIVGGVGDAGKAVAALTAVALRLDVRRPVVVRLPMDALYNEFGTMAHLEDPAGFYAKQLIPDWLPSAASVPAERSLRFEVLDHGRTHSLLARGTGAGEIAVYLDITDLKSMSARIPARTEAQTTKRSDRPAVVAPSILRAMKLTDLPGTPLETDKRAGLWMGRGDQAVGSGWGTLSESNGKVNHAHAESAFHNTPEENGLPFAGNGTVNADYYDVDGVANGRLDVAMMGEHNGASFRFLHQSAGLHSDTLLRAGVMRRDTLGPLRNDLNGKLGYLMSSTNIPGGGSSDQSEGQLLWGGGDTVSLGFNISKLSLVAQAGADAVWSQMYGKTQWDNYKLHGGVEAVLPLSPDLHLLGQYKHRLLENNPEKYFFTPTLDDDQALGGLAWKKGSFGAGFMGGVQRIRGEQADDNRTKGAVWLTAWDTTLTALASRGDWTQEITVALARKVGKDWNLEAYANRDSMVRYDYKQDTVGMRLAWGFGNSSGLPDERHYRPQRDDIYGQRLYQDRGLSQEVFAAQTSSVREVNEWSGKNLHYVTGDANKWARTPSETYGGRSGDCDEQAWLVSNSLNDNKQFRDRGGKAYILDYWTQMAGHGVSLIEEGGKTYLNEYGKTYRIDVDPNASVQAKGQAALKQVGRYLALVPGNGKPLQYVVFGTQNGAPPPPGGYDMTYLNENNRKSDWVYTPEFTTAFAEHPPVETGVNAIFGADSF